MPVIDELRIRNMDAEIALRLTSMAKKHGMSRSEYVKGILTNHVLSSQVKELDNQYQELFKTLRYIVRSHIVQNQEENSKLLSILRKVEEKIDILFDIENTKLIQQEAEVLYPVSMLESPVVTKASALRKENLANKKQKADYKKQKQGNMCQK